MTHEYVGRAIKVFTPFIGKKIIRISQGGFVEKVTEAIKNEFGSLPCDGINHVWLRGDSCYSGFYLKVNISHSEYFKSENGRDGHERQDNTVYIGECDQNGTLVKFCDNMNLDGYKTDFKWEEIAEVRAELKEAKKIVSQIEQRLFGFGESDQY